MTASESEDDKSVFSSLQFLLQEESEHQWAAMAAYGVAVLIVAALLHMAPAVGGVVDRPLLSAGESLVDFEWDSDGRNALIIVETNSAITLQVVSEGTQTPVLTPSRPTSIQTMMSGWIVGCENGQLGVVEGTTFTEIPLGWAGSEPATIVDATSVDGSSGWIIAGSSQASATLYRFGNGNTSMPSNIPVDEVRLKSVHADSDGSTALVLGVTTAFGNPLLAPSGEVVLHASAVGIATPDMTLLHHSGGAPLAAVHMIDNSDDLRAWVVGPSSTLLVRADMTVAEMSGVGGADASAVGGDGLLWLLDDGGSIRIVNGSDLSEVTRRYSPAIDDVTAAVAAPDGGIDAFHGDQQTRRVTIDASGEGSGAKDISIIMDASFLLVTIVIIGVLIRNFWEGGLDAW